MAFLSTLRRRRTESRYLNTVILCTLGIISVYSLAVVGKTISWKIAGATYSVVVLLGMVAGLAVRTLG